VLTSLRLLAVALILAAALYLQTALAGAQTAATPRIVGTWELVSRTVTRQDGTTIVDPVLGERPTGRLVYDAAGAMMLQMMRTGRKEAMSTSAAARDKADPRVVLGYDAYFGRYTVNEKAGTVTHHVEGSLYPDDLGSNWVRPFAVTADTLTLRFTSPENGITRTLVFRRMGSRNSNVAAKQMPDGKAWTTSNLNVVTGESYCYGDAEHHCGRYGRLYTWDAARRGCESLGDGWRLPTNHEWQQLAKVYGGLMEESDAGGRAAYSALVSGGTAGFNALLGGSRVSDKEQYARLEAHGFYWTASESSATSAWFYNFGKGGASINRHRGGDKQMAISARCVRP
jgi:uncharacterized protein (TIGR02145 family)